MTSLVMPKECAGSKFHSPTPLVTHLFDLATFGASDLPPKDPKDPVHLCGVCSDNLQVFLDLLKDGAEWEAQRRFGNRIRALGQRVIEWHKTEGTG